MLADGALSLCRERREHDDDAVVSGRGLDKVPELVPIEPDDGPLVGELPQLVHLLSQPASSASLLLPAIHNTTCKKNLNFKNLASSKLFNLSSGSTSIQQLKKNARPLPH